MFAGATGRWGWSWSAPCAVHVELFMFAEPDLTRSGSDSVPVVKLLRIPFKQNSTADRGDSRAHQ